MLAVQGAVVGKLPAAAAAAQSRPFCPTRLSPTGNHMSPVCWRRRQKQPPRRLCAPPVFYLRFSLRRVAPHIRNNGACALMTSGDGLRMRRGSVTLSRGTCRPAT